MLSFFTPTHAGRFLRTLHNTLHYQKSDYPWEWVLVPNGKKAVIPQDIAQDERVRIVPAPEGLTGVGALKRFACQQCKGELLCELDHDDWLAENAVEKLAEKLDYDFVYSSDVVVHPNGSNHLFDKDYGWEHADCEIDGKRYTYNKPFDITPTAMADIFYAPDHIRCWQPDAYWGAGGHDAEMTLCDDLDLMQRTYLGGYSFGKIDDPIYFYRRHEGNTCYLPEGNGKIQEWSEWLQRRRIMDLAREWCRREGHEVVTAGASFDLDQRPWNSVGLYHFPNGILNQLDLTDLIDTLNHLYDSLVPGGMLFFDVPHAKADDAYTPLAKTYWSEKTFLWYTRQAYAEQLEGYRARFQLASLETRETGSVLGGGNTTNIYAALSANKGQRMPGRSYWDL